MPGQSRRRAGFTLIELLIVAVILAVLLTVAAPAYEGAQVRGRRADAVSSLLELALRQEQYRLVHGRFTQDLLALGFTAVPAPSRDGYYSLRLGRCEQQTIDECFVATASAAPASSQLRDSYCTSFSLDARGERSATGENPRICW